MTGKKKEAPGSELNTNQIKTGRRPKPTRTFPSGSILFSEGQPGHELFLISEGEVIVTTGEKSDQVELARFGPGSIIGEMSLIDQLPRSATVTSAKDTKALVTTEAAFREMFKILPMWLSSVVKIIVTRLRETNRRIGVSGLKNFEKGVTHFLLMTATESKNHDEHGPLEFNYYTLLSEIQLATQLKREEVELCLEIMAEKKLIHLLFKGSNKRINIPKKEKLELYLDFLSFHELGISLPILNIGEEGRTLLNSLLKICKNRASGANTGTIEIELPDLKKAIEKENGTYRHAMIQVLLQNEFLTIENTDKAENNTVVLFSPEKIRKALDEYPWIRRFSRDSRTSGKSSLISARINQRKHNKQGAKPGVVPRSHLEKVLNNGELLFKEGDRSAEMYIVRSGCVRILKKEGERQLELASLGPGTVLGEMSLMDGEPRSATAQAVGELIVTCISPAHLNNTLERLPPWVSKLIKTVVGKLRKTNEKLYFERMRNGINTVARAILHQSALVSQAEPNTGSFCIKNILHDTQALSGLSSEDGIKILEHLEAIGLGALQKDKSGNSVFYSADMENLKLFYKYRTSIRSGKKNLAERVSKRAAALARVIAEAGRTRGSRSKGRCSVDLKQVLLQLKQMKIDPPELDREALLELCKSNLITIETKKSPDSQGAGSHEVLHYNTEQLPLLLRQLKWKSAFEKDIAAMLQ
jgi:CRP-like cAMP-binding protein